MDSEENLPIQTLNCIFERFNQTIQQISFYDASLIKDLLDDFDDHIPYFMIVDVMAERPRKD